MAHGQFTGLESGPQCSHLTSAGEIRTCEIINGRRPTARDGLVTGVGPSVTQVQVQVQAQPSCLGALGQRQIVVEVIAAVGRIDPDALADSGDARAGQDGLEGLGRPGRGAVRHARVLFDRYGGPVDALVGERRGRDGCPRQDGEEGVGEHGGLWKRVEGFESHCAQSICMYLSTKSNVEDGGNE